MSHLDTQKAAAQFTDENFDAEVIDSGVPALVDFWAEWCGPCKIVGPAVEKLAGKFAGKIRIGKLNVDENPATAARFGIRGIPSLLVFKHGKVVDRAVGIQTQTELEALIGQVL